MAVSDIITGEARVQVWLISKALNTHLSITDNGPYSLENVSFLKDSSKKPGLGFLFTFYKYSQHKSIGLGRLAQINWSQYFINDQVLPYNLDVLAKEHRKNFWARYGIDLNYNLEHKFENSFKKAAYIGKSHYAFLIYDNETQSDSKFLFKIRGVKVEDRFFYPINPIVDLLQFILFNDRHQNDIFIIPNNGEYKHHSLLKSQGWRRSLIKINNKIIHKDNFQPGQSIYIDRVFRLNNTYFHSFTAKEYYKRLNRSLRNISINHDCRRTIPLFEKYLPIYGIKHTIQLMAHDNLRAHYNTT